ncbi:hypothetical protein FSP39_006143 [Pinctada imbricata]|uniref:Uncharacterized protein n=1 Tax=Pinctada imbricata TaxID=66713 RepID=A0AA88YBS0_PINIB|nr:hypothetical protein FSP39_006143 [Pinctada imbricata]
MAGLDRAPRNLPSDTEVLDLSRNGIEHPDFQNTFLQIKFLDLSHNLLVSVDKRIRKFTKLKYLQLQNNRISGLENGIFSGLKYLSVLDLSQNHLSSIEAHAFGGLNYLQKLRLDGNRIVFLERQWFLSMPSLHWLYLSRNRISRIDGKMFETLSGLKMLKISHNNLRLLHNDSFYGLKGIRILDMSYNKLIRVPELHEMRNLLYLYLDSNPILRVSEGAFDNLNISMITLSYMSDLKVVERHAFKNLHGLVTLQIHDNVQLVYIDPEAFINCPYLKNLYLHNNQLHTISESIKDLPALTTIHFYNNRLVCDCNVLWMKQELIHEKLMNYTSVLFDDSILKCTSPPERYGMLLKEMPLDWLNKSCSPTNLPLFEDSYNISVGDELRLECHGIGVPEPEIQWRLPNNTVISGSVTSGRIEIRNNCTFIIRYLRESDSGTYTCEAVSDGKIDASSTAVIVNNKPVRLIPYGISGSYVTVTWNGTSSRWTMLSGYQIQYKEANNIDKTKVIPLGRHTRRYTFTNLKPRTTYMFCIVYVFEEELYTVDCENVTTKAKVDLPSGIYRVDTRLVIGVIIGLFSAFALICCFAVVRQFRRKKDYSEPASRKEERESLTEIALEELYQPSPTLMCTSTTSLIRAQES